MAAALPAINTDEIASRHQPQLSKFDTWRGDLEAVIKDEGITRDTANDAQELDTAAKRWLDGFDTETKPVKDSLRNAHKTFVAFCEKMSGGATAARAFARKTIGTYQLEEARIADEKRREAERISYEEAAAKKKDEVDRLLAEAAASGRKDILKAAERAKAAPMRVSLNAHPPQLRSLRSSSGCSIWQTIPCGSGGSSGCSIWQTIPCGSGGHTRRGIRYFLQTERRWNAHRAGRSI
jgi:hypothetical protein